MLESRRIRVRRKPLLETRKSAMYEVNVEQTFAAAHALRNYHGQTEPVHGHNFRVRVTIAGEKLDAAGLLYDFVALERALRGVIAGLDHRFLNELAPFTELNPSAENMAVYFHQELARQLPPAENSAGITAVTVWETDACSATYRP
jgi:6-pyruvoyltetrahydropterin/6-carboxytetrahydropterin synthase